MKDAATSCKGCTERQVGCHTTCSLYAKYKKEQNELKMAIEKAKEQDRVFKGIRRYF